VVDMSPIAVTGRLKEVSELWAQRGGVRDGADMSPEALSTRLKALGALSDMCRKLRRIGSDHLGRQTR
jgi:hypothetical protein